MNDERSPTVYAVASGDVWVREPDGHWSEGGHAVPVSFSWYLEDPFAICMTVTGVDWLFDRELLYWSLTQPNMAHGHGDVHVTTLRTAGTTRFTVHNGTDAAVIICPTANLARFSDHIENTLPRGTEAPDVDAWLQSFRLGSMR